MSTERSVDWIREQLRRAGVEDVRASGTRTLSSEPILLCVSAEHHEREIYTPDGARIATAAQRGTKRYGDLIALDFSDRNGQPLVGVTVFGEVWTRRVTARAPDESEPVTIALGGLRKGVIECGGTELGRLRRAGALRGALRAWIRPRFEVLNTDGGVVCRISPRAANVFEFTDAAGAELRALVPAIDLAVREWNGNAWL